MGQYYYGVIIDRDNKQPIMASYCGRLAMSNFADMASFAFEMSNGRKGYMQRLVWAGDYSKQEIYNGETLYDIIREREENNQKVATTMQELSDIRATICHLKGEEYDKAREEYEQQSEAYWMAHVYKENGDLREGLRYICDHDRREYYDLRGFYDYMRERRKQEGRDFFMYENPLAILTSDPTCRIQGGGDYFYRDGFEHYGTWSGDVISTEPEVPEGYKEVWTFFETKSRIWDPDTICELITGEEYGYRLPSPSAYDFGRSICHYDEKHCQLACVSRETILQMYADWSRKVDVERVYKAFDAVMRAVKNDPMLEQEHKGMTVEHRQHKNETTGYEWTDHVAIVNDVEVYLEKNEDGYKHDYKHNAMLGGIEYDCDTKSRRWFRRMAKERQAAA